MSKNKGVYSQKKKEKRAKPKQDMLNSTGEPKPDVPNSTREPKRGMSNLQESQKQESSTCKTKTRTTRYTQTQRHTVKRITMLRTTESKLKHNAGLHSRKDTRSEYHA